MKHKYGTIAKIFTFLLILLLSNIALHVNASGIRKESNFTMYDPLNGADTVPDYKCAAGIKIINSHNTFNFKDTSLLIQKFYSSLLLHEVLWRWEFEDGSISYGNDINHNFRKNGVFKVKLKKKIYGNSGVINHPCEGSKFDAAMNINVPCGMAELCAQEYIFTIYTLDKDKYCNQKIKTKIIGKDKIQLIEDTIHQQNNLLSRYYFDYGDGTSGTSKIHQYDQPGTYKISYKHAVYEQTILGCSEPGCDSTLKNTVYNGSEPLCTTDNTVEISFPLPDTNCNQLEYSSEGLEITLKYLNEMYICTPYDSIYILTSNFPTIDFGDGSSGTNRFHTYLQPGVYLACIINNSELNSDSTSQCCIKVVVNDQKIISSISPTPIQQAATFTINLSPIIYDLNFYNTDGTLVKSIQDQQNNSLQIDRNGLVEGLYYYQVVSNKKIISSGKMVVE